MKSSGLPRQIASGLQLLATTTFHGFPQLQPVWHPLFQDQCGAL